MKLAKITSKPDTEAHRVMPGLQVGRLVGNLVTPSLLSTRPAHATLHGLPNRAAFWNPPDRAGLAQCVPLRETHTPLAPTGTWEALVPKQPGPFPIRAFFARRRPWTNKCYPLAGTWQIAFLGEIEPRAARPGRPAPASDASRPAPASAVNERPRQVAGRVLGPSRQVLPKLPDRTGEPLKSGPGAQRRSCPLKKASS